MKLVNYKVILYLEEKMSKEEIKGILKKIRIHPKMLVRTKEKFWKDNYKNKDLSTDQYIDILIKYPKLIERPIITNKNNGVLGRPIDDLKAFVENI